MRIKIWGRWAVLLRAILVMIVAVFGVAGRSAQAQAQAQAQADNDSSDSLSPLPAQIIAPRDSGVADRQPGRAQSPAAGVSEPAAVPAGRIDLDWLLRPLPATKTKARAGPKRTPQAPRWAASPHIEWRLDNPFRLFSNASDTALHIATYQALNSDEATLPILSAERALARRHREGWAAGMAGRACWSGGRKRKGCKANKDYINPKSHAIVAQIKAVIDDALVDCTWRATPLAGRQRKIREFTVPCDVPVNFTVPYPSGVKLSVAIGGQPVAEKRVQVQDLLIVGMGDSFASGEGNPDVPVRFSRERSASYGKSKAGDELSGYPARIGSWRQIGDERFIEQNARWQDQACHRSLYSHQLRAALQLAIEQPQRAITYVGLSCSGAETTFGLFLYYQGNEWVPDPPRFSQISAAAVAQCGGKRVPKVGLPEGYHLQGKLPELQGLVLRKCNRKQARGIDLLFLSVGGNDVGFARLVANAVLSDKLLLKKLGGWFGQVHGARQANRDLRRLVHRYKSLNRALHNVLHIPWHEADRIILTGYPRMAVMLDGKTICPDGSAGMTVTSGFSLISAKAAESGLVATRLHRLMKAAAIRHKWTFVDAHRDAFLGRGICAGQAIGELGGANDLRIPRKINGSWVPYNPADWRSYEPRLRWFRTPNDAFMTGHFHVRASLMQKVLKFESLAWFQLLLASTYSGAFHPTAEGQAAIADATVVKARQVLQRYERAAAALRQNTSLVP